MTARVLVVDDVAANVRMLQARLHAEYLDVVTACDGNEALDKVEACHPDLVLLDVMMPGIDGFEVCRRIKSAPRTTHLPVVMVTCLDEAEHRITALDAGADAFLTKPVSRDGFMARVKNLVRSKMLTDDLRQHDERARAMGLADQRQHSVLDVDSGAGRMLVIEPRPILAARVARALGGAHNVHVAAGHQAAERLSCQYDFDVVFVGLSNLDSAGLRLCARLRSTEATRQTPLVALLEPGDPATLVRALDIGVNAHLIHPTDPAELVALARGQTRWKRYRQELARNADRFLAKAVTDELTGLHNRRFLERRLEAWVPEAQERGEPISAVMLDVDRFKNVNDALGHDVGDAVLREVAERLESVARGSVLLCRHGGEEFVAALPGVGMDEAREVAERLRRSVAAHAFSIESSGEPLRITVSAGVSTLEGGDDTAAALLKRADAALYRAKKEGRDRVCDHP